LAAISVIVAQRAARTVSSASSSSLGSSVQGQVVYRQLGAESVVNGLVTKNYLRFKPIG
jgi:hypothetical protein